MFKIRNGIIITLIVLSCFSCVKTENSEEKEPNNTISAATPITAGRDYTGFLETENDIDYFILKIDEPQILRVELSGIKGVNHAIRILKLQAGNFIPMKTIDDNRKSSPEEIANLYTEPGEYIIIVTHGTRDVKKGNSENRYTLRVSARSPMNEEQEPNDSYLAANYINNGDSVTGYFSPSRNMLNETQQNPYREEDWFRADIVTGEDSPVTVDLILTGVNGVDSILILYDSNMKELVSSDVRGAGGAEAITGFGVRTSGTYYILVAAKSYQYNHSEPYELSMKLNIHDSGSELEPNGSFDSSGRVSGNSISGRINHAGDQDYFYYDEFKNSNVRIKIQSDPELDTVLTVFSSEKVKIVEVNNSGTGSEEIIPAVFVNNGIYIKVNSTQPSVSDLPYKITFERIDGIENPEREPNNSIKEANLIGRGVTGFTSFKNDKDYFLIKSNERVRYKVNARGPQNGSIRLSTTDPMGYIIKTRNISSGETVSFIELFDRKGYLIVETVNPDYDNYYTIDIEEIR